MVCSMYDPHYFPSSFLRSPRSFAAQCSLERLIELLLRNSLINFRCLTHGGFFSGLALLAWRIPLAALDDNLPAFCPLQSNR